MFFFANEFSFCTFIKHCYEHLTLFHIPVGFCLISGLLHRRPFCHMYRLASYPIQPCYSLIYISLAPSLKYKAIIKMCIWCNAYAAPYVAISLKNCIHPLFFSFSFFFVIYKNCININRLRSLRSAQNLIPYFKLFNWSQNIIIFVCVQNQME